MQYLEDGHRLQKWKMCDGTESNVSTKSNENRDIINKENVNGQSHIPMQLPDLLWNLNYIQHHCGWSSSHSLPFQCHDIRSPNYISYYGILNGDWAI